MLDLEKLKSRKKESQNRFNQNKYKSIGIANRCVKWWFKIGYDITTK